MNPMRTFRRLAPFVAGPLAAIVFLTLGTPYAAHAQDDPPPEAPPPESYQAPVSDVPLPDDLAAQVEGDRPLTPEEAELRDRAANAPPTGAPDPAAVPEDTTYSLPTGEAKSAVTPSRISLPNAEGSVEGMGESFAPVLSSGTATFSVPIALPAGRNGVQPSLGLSYASTGGNSSVGFGWNLSVPFIVRQSDRGLPRYIDGPGWHPREDRFFYNGGQELVPVDNGTAATVDGYNNTYAGTGALPADIDATWQQYRARIEGGFMRFFRSPDSTTWIVQGKDGTRFDFGLLPLGEGPADLDPTAALQTEATDGSGLVYGWFLTRMSDPHGSTVYYRYRASTGGQRYLDDLYYLSPASCAGSAMEPSAGTAAQARACAAPLSDYGVRVHLDYQVRPDIFTTYTSGWGIAEDERLTRVVVTVAPDMTVPGGREMVRRYHLTYQSSASSFHSLLASVQVEGRPDSPVTAGPTSYDQYGTVSEAAALGTGTTLGRLLPAMTFGYTAAPTGPIPGFGGVASTVYDIPNSPSVSADAARADLFDVNSDGLPDLVVTDPARYRTASGEPAAGVFFNGFQGPSAAPAYAASFSDAVPVGVPSGLSGVLNMASSTVLPMDVEGDGRSDFLHLPRRDRYGFFAPTRTSDEVAGNSVRPSAQGWRFTYGPVALPTGADPRIDLVREPERYRTMDVNGDHLIDILKTTGRSMQTWLNLGYVEGGEGQFGQAIWNASTESWDLSNEPYETCLMHDGLPLDFSDPELRTADMNGDGLVDLVRLRRGRVLYWPGRGTTETGAPVFGLGPAHCPAGFATGREIRMATPPAEINTELDGVFLSDVNGDGASDVVQVRFDDVDVWFNQAGEGFTDRVTIATPAAPGFSPNVRLADIDGSGTLDIVYTNAGRWQYIDLAGGTRARLLDEVWNGLGASTHLTYGSSVDDYLADLTEADGDPSGENFTWSKVNGACDGVLSAEGAGPGAASEQRGDCVYRSGGSPVVSTVVRQVETDDHFDALGRQKNVTQTAFAYHDGYYEGIEQEFRGFGAADAIAYGDAQHPTAVTRTHFRQGRRPTSIASDRLADNPREALKGRQWLSEVMDEYGAYLSSSHATIRIRHLLDGLDGRGIYYGYVSQTDELTYGTTYPAPGAGSLALPAVQTESVDGAGAVTPPTTIENRQVEIRMADWAHIRSTTDEVDNLGQVRNQKALGRIAGAITLPPDQVIEGVTVPSLENGALWIWRTAESYVLDDTFSCPSGGSCKLGWTTNTYNELGGLTRSAQIAERPIGVPAYRFGGDGAGAEDFGSTPTSETLEASTAYDAWGSALQTCAGGDVGTPSSCARFAAVAYDAAYAQLPITESVAVHTSSAGYCDTSLSVPFCMVSTSATWDRGFGALLDATDPNERTSAVTYDGLGRLTAVHPPAIAGDCAIPTQTFVYDLVPGGEPISVVESYQHVGCSGTVNQTRSYVDGLGRARAALVRSELTSGAVRLWQQTGVSFFNARGTPYLEHNPVYLYADPPSPTEAVAAPTTPAVTQTLDPFGRPAMVEERDGSKSYLVYYALETEAFDPLDTGDTGTATGSELFLGTPTIARVDGHGRGVEQVLHNRVDGADEYYRLQTTYRADGAVVSVRRLESTATTRADMVSVTALNGHELSRLFWHDTAGRRIGTVDPDSDTRDPTKPNGERGWRYLFNRVGDLIAVRDARGCGQNFYYDHAGRLVAEDYVECGESQPGDEPDSADALDADHYARPGVPTSPSVLPDVRHYFDEAPHYASTMPTPPTPPGDRNLIGRFTGSVDRGQRSMVDYDERGRPVWSARQMAVLPTAGAAVTSIPNPAPSGPAISVSDGEGAAPTRPGRIFDEAHSYVSTSTYDRIDRASAITLPDDPDFDDPSVGGTSTPPVVGGTMTYNARGLPYLLKVTIDGTSHPVSQLLYSAAAQLERHVVGGEPGNNGVALGGTFYDARLRPFVSFMSRRPEFVDQTPGSEDIDAVYVPFDFSYSWDAADNLWRVEDRGRPFDTPAGIHPSYEPRETTIGHDALYRVVNVDYRYRSHVTGSVGDQPGPASDWRDEQTHHEQADPMRRKPAPMVSALPAERPRNFTYQYDWLANQTEWTDDANAFYERSLGTNVLNGHEAGKRPAALYFSSNLTSGAAYDPTGTVDRGGWASLEYGESGNVQSMTVRGQCHDLTATTTVCEEDSTPGTNPIARDATLRGRCTCDVEHHYQYRWDELNRLAEARRYDRGVSGGDWELQVRQRYLYDGANVRMVKGSRSEMAIGGDGTDGTERAALYVYPGDFERRGLQIDTVTDEYIARVPDGMGGWIDLGAETQYLVAGARLVWKEGATPGSGGTGFENEARLTYAVPNLIQSTSAVIDLFSGQLLERGTYYPNGARETLRTERSEGFSLEPMGFTGKEGDDEVGLVYFGERYLMPHLGRWASADPLQVHAGGGGEFGNSYHYVSGNLLQARDPTGLGPPGEELVEAGVPANANLTESSESPGSGSSQAPGEGTGFYVTRGPRETAAVQAEAQGDHELAAYLRVEPEERAANADSAAKATAWAGAFIIATIVTAGLATEVLVGGAAVEGASGASALESAGSSASALEGVGSAGATTVAAATAEAAGTATAAGSEGLGAATATAEAATGGMSQTALAVEQGLVRAGGRLEAVLGGIEAEVASAPPTTATEALTAIQSATARIGLEPGVASLTSSGEIVLTNVGGITTTIGRTGSIVVQRGADVLLRLAR